jgi:hypothetical protein
MARLRYAVLLLFLLVGASCSDDEEDPVGPGPTTSQFTGVFTSSSDGGLMTLSIPLATGDLAPKHPARTAIAHDVQALATLALDAGGTINLAGTYSEENRLARADRAGLQHDGTATIQSGPVPGVTGEWTGPPGPGFSMARSVERARSLTTAETERARGSCSSPCKIGVEGLSDSIRIHRDRRGADPSRGHRDQSAASVYSLMATRESRRGSGAAREWNLPTLEQGHVGRVGDRVEWGPRRQRNLGARALLGRDDRPELDVTKAQETLDK